MSTICRSSFLTHIFQLCERSHRTCVTLPHGFNNRTFSYSCVQRYYKNKQSSFIGSLRLSNSTRLKPCKQCISVEVSKSSSNSKFNPSRQFPIHWSHRMTCIHSTPVSAFSTSAGNPEEDAEKRAKASGENGHQKEQFQYKNWRTLLTIPNLLTITRVAFTPYLGYLVLCESYQAACGLFFLAGITDMLDGWIARKFPSQASPVGSFMDPLADKFLVSTLFITLTLVNLIPAPLTCLVVARDISLIAAAFYVRTISLPPPVTLSAVFDISNQTAELRPTLISKVNTAIQLGLVTMTLAAPVIGIVDHPILQAIWYVTAGTTIWSGIGYIFAKDTFKIYKQKRRLYTKTKLKE